jgi:hypothetical protein
MSENLAIYLNDHLAGANLAIDLLNTLSEEHNGEPLGEFVSTLRSEVGQDRDVLKGLIERMNESPPLTKEAASWLVAKLSEAKLRPSIAGKLGTFQALEMLSLGTLGKRALWRALPIIAEKETRLGGVDFEKLSSRAEQQHSLLEEHRLQAARAAF